MVTAAKARILDGLFDAYGTDLQAVAYYDLDGYDLWFLREDVSQLYTGSDFERIWETISFEKAVEPAENELYHDAAGTYQATVRVFERALVSSIRLDESGGLYVALDRDAEPTHASLVDVVTDVPWPEPETLEEHADGSPGITGDDESDCDSAVQPVTDADTESTNADTESTSDSSAADSSTADSSTADSSTADSSTADSSTVESTLGSRPVE